MLTYPYAGANRIRFKGFVPRIFPDNISGWATPQDLLHRSAPS
jgi:hypothetical protein